MSDSDPKNIDFTGARAICHVRRDATGVWNFCKTWYIYLLHLTSSVLFTIALFTLVDGRNFSVGTASRRGFELNQADVTGIVSTTLVVIRSIAGFGTTLLVWRLVTILLAKGQITLTEICRIVGSRNPWQSQLAKGRNLAWSVFTFIIVMLLWPPPLAAPLANSSLTWHPQKQEMRSGATSYRIKTVETKDRFSDFQYKHEIEMATLNAIATGVLAPDYAFTPTFNDSLLRRYVSLDPPMLEGATGTMTMPYFNVTHITWLNSSSYQGAHSIANASMLESPAHQFGPGTMGFWMPTKWTTNNTKSYAHVVYKGRRPISIQVGSLYKDVPLRNGQYANHTTPCPNWSAEFGALPNVTQWPMTWFYGTNPDGTANWVRTDCYMLANVNMTIGRYAARPVDLSLLGSSTGAHIINGTVPNRANATLQPDWAIIPTLDMMTDVMRQIFQLNATQRYRLDNLDGYVRGSLKHAYDATWSAMPFVLDDSFETVRVVPLESVIQARVNRTRVWIWLCMNLTLQIAAVAVALVQVWSAPGARMTRDTTLMPLMMDLRGVGHVNGDGLCSAVALGGSDRRLWRLRWAGEGGEGCGRVVFEGGKGEGESVGVPLLGLR